MSETIKILWSYIKQLLRKWIIWLSLAFFVIGVLFEFALSIEEIPSYIFLILAFMGFLWASFQVYKNLLKKKITKKERELLFKPELSIILLEGNEYTYSLSETAILREKTGNDYLTPDGSIELHLRIMNKGTIDLDIISIQPDYKDFEIPWSFNSFGSLKEKGKELFFPLHLDVKEVLLGDMTCQFMVHSTLNDAQFATRLVEIDKESKRILSRVDVEARDTKGKIHTFSHSFKVFIRPLMDLYIKRWQEKNQEGLLRLSRSEDE